MDIGQCCLKSSQRVSEVFRTLSKSLFRNGREGLENLSSSARCLQQEGRAITSLYKAFLSRRVLSGGATKLLRSLLDKSFPGGS